MKTYYVINMRSGKVVDSGLSYDEMRSYIGDDYGFQYRYGVEEVSL